MSRVWEEMISLNVDGETNPEVLGPAAQYRAVDSHPSDWSTEEATLDQHLAADTYPLPRTEDREGYYGPHHFSFWASGHRDLRLLRECAARHGAGFDDYFDLGCASGRVIRHAITQVPETRVYASDINRRHVDWVAKHLDPSIMVFQNHSIPSLPLPDNSVDVISAYSVMTHVEVFDTSWIAEMRRILRPGGIAWVTVHSENTWQQMEPGWPLYDAMLNFPQFAANHVAVRGDLPGERVVFRHSTETSYSSNSFYSMDYIRRTWGRIMPIVEEMQRVPDYQDVVILQKQ